MKNILLLGGDTRIELSLILKKEFNLFSIVDGKYSPITQINDSLTIDISDLDLVKKIILDYSVKNKIHVIIPLHPKYFILCYLLLPDLEKNNIKLLLSSKETVDIMMDKLFLENELSKIGIKTIPKLDTINNYPFFLKFRFGYGSIRNKIIYSMSQIPHNVNISQEYIIQEYIETKEEFSIDCLCGNRHEPICIIPRIRLSTENGEIITSITTKNIQLINLTKKILSHFKFVGPVNLQCFKFKNEFYFFDINPRLPGGITLSIKAGFPIIKYINEFIQGEIKLKYSLHWKDSLFVHRVKKDFYFEI